MPDRIRVVHVLDNLNIGGTELNAVRTAERLDRERFDVRFLCLQAHGPLRERLDRAGIPVGEIPVTSLLSTSAVRRGLEIRDLVRREEIHVVHAHDPYGNVLAAPFVRLAGRGAVIASQRWWRNVHRPRVRFANRVSYRFAHRVLANSRAIAELLVREEGVARDRVVVIPNFVEDEAFHDLAPGHRSRLRESVGLGPTDIAIGVVANLYPVKNHAMLLRAARRLATDWPRIRFVLVGDGAERASLERLASESGIRDQVLMPGRLTNEPGFAGIFDIAVLTSREEGFPNWVVEAMAAGRPVVATNVGGVPDAVVEGETGMLVKHDDDEAMARALDDLLRDESLRLKMGNAARVRARSKYHDTAVLSDLSALYEDLAARYGR
jgi:glycosyltransferase involved in cell wall biosynthesis